jgi:hypothetical protein
MPEFEALLVVVGEVPTDGPTAPLVLVAVGGGGGGGDLASVGDVSDGDDNPVDDNPVDDDPLPRLGFPFPVLACWGAFLCVVAPTAAPTTTATKTTTATTAITILPFLVRQNGSGGGGGGNLASATKLSSGGLWGVTARFSRGAVVAGLDLGGWLGGFSKSTL